MSTDALDELDFGILHLLQRDARNETPTDMADRLPVTDTTVRNRIEKLENRGVIQGYVPLLDYEKAGFPLRVKFTCSAPVQERSRIADEALDVKHVVHVEEMLSARENVRILVVTNDAEDLNDVSSRIDELDLEIESESLLRHRKTQPFDQYGETMVARDE